MASAWKASRLFSLLIFWLLPACSREPATKEEASKALKSCGMVMQRMYGAGGFDVASNVIVIKEIPKLEFDKKLRCLKVVLFVSRKQASINNGERSDTVDIGI
jgi:hypothetical protein